MSWQATGLTLKRFWPGTLLSHLKHHIIYSDTVDSFSPSKNERKLKSSKKERGHFIPPPEIDMDRLWPSPPGQRKWPVFAAHLGETGVGVLLLTFPLFLWKCSFPGRRGCISWSLPLDCTLIYDKNSFCRTAFKKIFFLLVWVGSNSLSAVNTPRFWSLFSLSTCLKAQLKKWG